MLVTSQHDGSQVYEGNFRGQLRVCRAYDPRRTAMVTTPKQNPNSRVWYRYYAGYTEEFVASLIGHLGIRRNSWVLDPWNGAGTTTAVAHRLGYKSIGLDVNPALVLIGKARSLDVNVFAPTSGQRPPTCGGSNWPAPKTHCDVGSLQGARTLYGASRLQSTSS